MRNNPLGAIDTPGRDEAPSLSLMGAAERGGNV